MVHLLRDVWDFRSFIRGSVKREFQMRYQGTQFGAFWIVAQPLAMILVYIVVFAGLMQSHLPGHTSRFAYGIYLCSGVLNWNLFAEMLGRYVQMFVENANLLKKVKFPKLCLPIIIVLSSLINYCIIMAIFAVFLLGTGNFPGWIVLSAIPILLILVAFTIGLGVFLATINVFYRDVQQLVMVILQFWFWLTPVVYVAHVLPPIVGHILVLNPLWAIMNAFHQVFLEHQAPQWGPLIYPALLAAVFMIGGFYAFRKLQGEIVDAL